MPRKLTRLEVIDRANEVHGYKYIYDKMNYVDTKTKVCIGCKTHGDFWQRVSAHLSGQGCPACSNQLISKKNSKPFSQFEEEARKVHGDKYVYDESTYTYALTKMRIICPEHGEFWQTPANHLSGLGCRKCGRVISANKQKLSFNDFTINAKKVHGDKYIYDENKINYVNNHTKICISCPTHGDFWQTPKNHLKGYGCSKCMGREIFDFKSFKEKSEIIHNGKYIYNDSNYVNYDTPIRITCPKHGYFWQTPNSHLNGHGCPKCGNTQSKGEDEINNFINTECHIQTITRNRKFLGERLECDVIIPTKKLIIEFDGILWHSEKFGKDKNYHLHKTELAESKGYHLIHIFEDEWLEHKDLVLSKIKHILGCDTNKPVIGARNCTVKTLSKPLTEQFLNTYHLQGFSPSTALYGAYFGDILVGVMTFKKEKEGIWNFNRFATNTDYRLPGLASKMFKQFVKDNNPTEVKAFLDRRWSHCDSNLYDKMGFKLVETLAPDYEYGYRQQRSPKSKFNKQSLAKEHNLPLTMTEKEMAEQLGFYRIWDCGLYKYVWKPSIHM